MSEQTHPESASAPDLASAEVPRRPEWQAVGFFACGYAVCLAVGYALAIQSDSFLTLWLANGFFLATLILRDVREWPMFVGAAFLVSAAVFVVPEPRWSVALTVGAINGARAVTGAWLVRKFVGRMPTFSRVSEVGIFLLTATVNAALWSGVVLAWAGALGFGYGRAEWFLWWSRDLIGSAVVVPVVLSFARGRVTPRLAGISSSKLEAAVLAVSVLAGGTFVFNDAWHPHVPLSHALVPLLIWAATRFGVPGVSLSSLALVVLGSAFTSFGAAAIESEVSLLGQVNRLNLFLGVASGTGLLLAASMAETVAALARHRDAHLRLDAIFSGTRDALIVADADTGMILDANPAAAALFGRPVSQLVGQHQTSLHPPEQAGEYTNRFRERAHQSEPGLGAAEAVRADGARIPVEISSRTVTLADGRLAVVGAFRDVSERRRSEDRYRSILQSSMDGFWVVAADARVEDANDVACEMTGYSRDELLAMHVWDIDADENRDQATMHVGEIRAAGRHRFVTRHRRKDGQVLDVEVSTLLVPDASGRTVAFVRDITDDRRSSGIMQARLRLLEYAATHSLGDLLVATIDEAEALTGSGIGFLHLLEADQQTVSTQAWSTRTRREACRADARSRHANVSEAGVWADCVRERRAVVQNDYVAVSQRKGVPDGHAPLIREAVVPVFRNGLIVALLGVGNKPDAYTDVDVETLTRLADLAWDITERKRSEESLRVSEERYRLLVETSNEGIWVMDGDHVTTYVNQAMAELLGYAPADIVGRPVEDFFFPEDLAFHNERMALRHAGTSEVYERRFRKRDGTALWTLASAKSLRSDDGRFLGSFALFSDITERKDAERELERSRAELKALTRQLVEAQEIASRELARELHDRVGQNLTALNLNFTRLQEFLPPQRDPRVIGPLQESLRLVSETMGHVRDVMAELRPPVLEDYGVYAAVRWLGGQFARRTALVVTVKAEDGVRPSPDVETAVFRIAQEALTNVVRHASARTVLVELIGEDHRLRLRVRDDGVGFNTGSVTRPGCWGLLTMMERAEAVEGRLTIQSGPGVGTLVEVDVPA
jgi:PAS domain S-box-containing protein